ncbi:MAG: glycosyltransferase [Actinomycetota bacterium]|nr:glycosyltransferase [Actinomycetota bacterium]
MTTSPERTPSVSVIVPVKDDPRLELCLEALVRQTYPEDRVEIVVADNGSDGPPSGLAASHPRVTLLHEPQPGSYAARNAGVRHAKGEVVAFTDADCLPDPTWLERAVARLGDDADIVTGEITVFAADLARPTPIEAYEVIKGFPQRRYATESGWAATANLVTTRRVLDAVGPFDQRLRSGGDADWGCRATGQGFRLRYDESVRVRHPARVTFAECYLKLVRVHQGAHDRARLAGRRSPVRLKAGSLVPPLGALRRSNRPDALPGLRARLAYVVGEVFVRYAAVSATLRVRRESR